MILDKRLTIFQRNTYLEIVQILDSKQVKFVTHIYGEKESYIQIDVVNLQLVIWIYEDEAQVKGTSIHMVFEIQDYESSDELRQCFVSEFESYLMRSS